MNLPVINLPHNELTDNEFTANHIYIYIYIYIYISRLLPTVRPDDDFCQCSFIFG